MPRQLLNGLRNACVIKWLLVFITGLCISTANANDDNSFSVKFNQRSNINDCSAVAPQTTSAKKGKWTEIPWAPTNIQSGDSFAFEFCVAEQEITDDGAIDSGDTISLGSINITLERLASATKWSLSGQGLASSASRAVAETSGDTSFRAKTSRDTASFAVNLVDATAPTMSISAANGSGSLASGSTSSDTSLSLTFTSSESTSDFSKNDVTVSNGSISDFSGSGTTYTATLTPDGDGTISVDVAANKFTDAAGNDNTSATQYLWNYQATAPTMSISAANGSGSLASGSTSSDTSLTLTFTSSATTSNFSKTDVTVSNGSISDFSGSGTTYTATLTPAGDGTVSVDVAANKFTDEVGNNNTAATQYVWHYQAIAPTITISAANGSGSLASGSTTNDASLSLTFTTSQSTSNFKKSDVSVSNASISSFSGSGTTYTATLTPDSEGAVTVDVPANTFTDAAGNNNTAATQFQWTYDGTAPGVSITASVANGSTTNDSSITLTFTLTESSTDFTKEDINVTNATLGTLSGSGTSYSITLTPSSSGSVTVDVAANKFTDAAGNNNTAATQFQWTYDGTAPGVSITASVASGSTTNDSSITLTFTLTESSTNFTKEDISVTNGTLGSLSGSGTTYTATLTPDSEGAVTVDVPANKFTDAAGNNNTAATQFQWTYDGTAPGVSITASVASGSTTNDSSITLTFTLTESSTNFTKDDISVSNTTIGSLSGSGTRYSMTLTPSSSGSVTVDVPANKFTDAAGNNNTAAAQFQWTYDGIAPAIAITANVTNGSSTNDSSITLSFTLTESSANFTQDDISVTNATLGSFSGSGSSYTASLTADNEGAVIINVPANKFTDAAGNNNTAAAQIQWNYDSTPPGIAITASIANGSTTNDSSITLTFTLTESSTNFTKDDISVTNATLGSLSGSGTSYSITLTPNGSGSVTVDIPANKFSDAAGNNNTAAAQFHWTYDGIAPGLAITASAANGSTTNDSSISLNFTLTESSTEFTKEDINVTNGTLGSFSGSGSSYTAILTADSEGAVTVDIPANKFTDAAGNNNTAATQFQWTYDGTAPTVSITAVNGTSTIGHGSTSDHDAILIIFTLSEAPQAHPHDFTTADIVLTNASSKSELTCTDLICTLSIAPIKAGLVEISVPAAAFKDTAGNDNQAAMLNWQHGSDPSKKEKVAKSAAISTQKAMAITRHPFKAVNARFNWLNSRVNQVARSYQGIHFKFANPHLEELFNGTAAGYSQGQLADFNYRYLPNAEINGPLPLQDVKDQFKQQAEQQVLGELRTQLGIPTLNPVSGPIVGDWALWTEGQITIGNYQPIDTSSQKSRGYALTAGLDKPFRNTGVIGGAITLGADHTEIGGPDSTVEAYNYNLSLYTGFHTQGQHPVELTLGAGRMNFYFQRQDGTQQLNGQRRGEVIYASAKIYQSKKQSNALHANPYGMLETSVIKLDQYRETGGSLALQYSPQKAHQTSLSMGLEIDSLIHYNNGRLAPFAIFEVGMDISHSSDVVMAYIGQQQQFNIPISNSTDAHWLFKTGFHYNASDILTIALSVEHYESINNGSSNTFRCKLNGAH